MTGMTDLQRRVLTALAEDQHRSMTANRIGLAVGARRIRRFGYGGSWTGTMGPAQQIIPVLTSLRRRDLIRFAERRDGLSGTAYAITGAGREALADEIGGAS